MIVIGLLQEKKSLRISRVIRSRKSQKNIKYSGQKAKKNKQWSTKHYKESKIMSNPTKHRGWTLGPGRESSSCITFSTHPVIAKRDEHHLIWKSCCTTLSDSIHRTCTYWSPRFNLLAFMVYDLWEELADTKGVIRIHKSNDRQRNGQKKRDERTNNDLQTLHL